MAIASGLYLCFEDSQSRLFLGKVLGKLYVTDLAWSRLTF